MLAVMLNAFKSRGPASLPIVIVTADHGEALGEHGHPYHSTDLYNSQIHVPLVIAGPGIPPHRIGETVSLTDLVPSILELAGFQGVSGPSIDGRSFADLASATRPSTEDGVAFAAMIRDRSNPGGITTIIRGRWKLIDNGESRELYDIAQDPSEQNNLIEQEAARATELGAMLESKRQLEERSPFAH
jgi:arylsulfatase A-like enzyme